MSKPSQSVTSIEPRFIALTFRAPIDFEERLQGFMLMHATVEGVEETAAGLIKFFIPRAEWNEELRAEIDAITAQHSDIVFLDSELLEEHDWNAEWESSIEPQRITEQLVVTPSWKKAEVENSDARYVITIDPKMSFGTGHHETTRLCLRASESIDVTDLAVLDIGTGSGLLAIYALLRGAKAAVGIDTDPWSIENAVENRELNDILASRFEVRHGTLLEVVPESEMYDLIFANIHRNVLLEIAEQIKQRCNPGGFVILSGLLVYDADEVMKHFQSIGFHFVKDILENEWACLVFQNNAAS